MPRSPVLQRRGKHLGEQLACPGGIGVAECVEVAREGEGGGVLRVGICGAGDVPLTRALRVYAHGGEDTGWRGCRALDGLMLTQASGGSVRGRRT